MAVGLDPRPRIGRLAVRGISRADPLGGAAALAAHPTIVPETLRIRRQIAGTIRGDRITAQGVERGRHRHREAADGRLAADAARAAGGVAEQGAEGLPAEAQVEVERAHR